MSEKAALLEMLQRTASVPWPLALDAEHHSLGIRAHAARTPQSAAHRNHLSVRRDLHRPAAEQVVRLVGTAQAERHPDVAFRIVLGAKGKFVTLRVAPVVAQRVVAVRDLIAVGVGNAGDFPKLGGRHRTVFPGEAEDFILAAGEQVILRIRAGTRRRP